MPRRRAADIVPYADALREFQRTYWRNALKAAGGNVSRLARESRSNRTHLHVVLKRFGLAHLTNGRREGNAAWRALGR